MRRGYAAGGQPLRVLTKRNTDKGRGEKQTLQTKGREGGQIIEHAPETRRARASI